MDLRARFIRYAADFDRTVQDDDWSRVRAHFTEDAVREEHEPPVIDIRVEGLDRIIEQWRDMVENIDRKFDRRIVVNSGPVTQQGDVVVFPWVGVYVLDGTPALFGEGREVATYRGSRIRHLRTTWSPETVERNLSWVAKYGERAPWLLEYAARKLSSAHPQRSDPAKMPTR